MIGQISGPAVILTDEHLSAVLSALLLAAQVGKRNGLQVNKIHVSLIREIQDALATTKPEGMSARGLSDVRKSTVVHHRIPDSPVTVAEAADQLDLCARQVRRIARKLGGRKIRNTWVFDQADIDEHMKGRTA